MAALLRDDTSLASSGGTLAFACIAFVAGRGDTGNNPDSNTIPILQECTHRLVKQNSRRFWNLPGIVDFIG